MSERDLLLNSVWTLILRSRHEGWTRQRLLRAIDQFVLLNNRADGTNPISDVPAKTRAAMRQGELRVFGELD